MCFGCVAAAKEAANSGPSMLSRYEPSNGDGEVLSDFGVGLPAFGGDSSDATIVNPSGNAGIDGLLSGVRWSGSQLTVSYTTTTAAYPLPYGDTALNTFAPLTNAQAQAFNFAFGLVADYTNLQFFAAQFQSTADIRIANFTEANGVSRGYYPHGYQRTGDIWMGNQNDNLQGMGPITNPTAGDFNFATHLHELGHALGLKHGHETGIGGTTETPDGRPIPLYGPLPSSFDNWNWSLMTYRSDTGVSTQTVQGNLASDNPMTFMPLDILALQYMYGANYAGATSGNTTWRWDTNGFYSINGTAQLQGNNSKVLMTVWDGGGIDLYDFSLHSANQSIDLRPGFFSTFNPAQVADLNQASGQQSALGNVANAYLFNNDLRSIIENVTAGSGNDTIVGNQVANTIWGNGGNDSIFGQEGNDQLSGGTGSDSINGNDGNDTIWGGDDADTLGGDAGNDMLFGGNGFDWIYGGGGVDTLNGEEGNDTLFGGNEGDTIGGDNGSDYIAGEHGDDWLFGGFGNDTIAGGDGNDNIQGNQNDDTIGGGWGEDTINGGDGNDWIYGEGNSDTIGGDAGNDVIFGGSHADWLYGLDGNDRINGEDGADWIYGGNNDDILNGGNDGDLLNGGAGVDTLGGDGGADYLDGGADTDYLWGGGQNDRFHFAGFSSHDYIMDFQDGVDQIDLRGEGWGYTSSSQFSIVNDGGGNAFISLGFGTWITVMGISSTQLSDADFSF